MADLFGAIQRGLGLVLNGIYEFIPSYGVAIVLLTLASRALLMPLTVKQIRSMRAMQKLAPELKTIQKKYKDMQKKAKDRAEVQQIRLKMNEETMALYREHKANPLGGCFPLLAQMPVFIALFSIMRATVLMAPLTAASLTGGSLPADTYTEEQRAATICRPVTDADAEGTAQEGLLIRCLTSIDGEEDEQRFRLSGLNEVDGSGAIISENGVSEQLVALCLPVLSEDGNNTTFQCRSATGTGHLPREGELFADVNDDKARVFGMHPGCSPSQANSKSGLRQCTAEEQESAGGLRAFPYYLLVLLIGGSQYVASKQMMARSAKSAGPNPMAQQQQMMTRIMPIFFAFISLNFPTGTNTYFLATNLWQIGQQTIMLRKHDDDEPAAGSNGQTTTEAEPKTGFFDRIRQQAAEQQKRKSAPAERAPEAAPEPKPEQGPQGGGKKHSRSKKKKKRKRR